jgi:integrase
LGRKTNQNNYHTDEKWELCNPLNINLTSEFMDYLSASGKSIETQKKYLNNLQIFFVWVLDNLEDKSIAEINKKDFMKWQNYMAKKELSSSRIRMMRSSVSSLCNYIENMCDEEYPDFRNVVNKVPAPKLIYNREKTYLDFEDFEAIKQELIEQQDWQKLVYITLSYDSACRLGEAHKALKTIDFVNNKTNVVTGKGGKTFPLYFSDETKVYIQKYLEIRGNDDCDKLFIVKNNGKIEPAKYSTLYKWCEKFSKILLDKTGKNMVIYPHCFKSNKLTHLYYDDKLPINVIQEYGHHNDSSTTLNSYIQKRDNDVLDQVFKKDRDKDREEKDDTDT